MIYQIQNHIIGIKILKDLGHSKQKNDGNNYTKTDLVLFKVKTQANLLHASG